MSAFVKFGRRGKARAFLFVEAPERGSPLKIWGRSGCENVTFPVLVHNSSKIALPPFKPRHLSDCAGISAASDKRECQNGARACKDVRPRNAGLAGLHVIVPHLQPRNDLNRTFRQSTYGTNFRQERPTLSKQLDGKSEGLGPQRKRQELPTSSTAPPTSQQNKQPQQH